MTWDERQEVRRIYLDNAATSWPKPETVYAASDAYLRQCGAPAGRSAYRDAVEAERSVDEVRRRIASLLGCDDARRIIFTLNGTDALNLAIHGLLAQHDHVVTTDAEHNSVLRPLRFLEETAGVQVTRVGCDASGRVSPDAVAAELRPDTKLVAVTHASNVTGTLQPIAAIAQALQGHPALFLVDAAQTVGHLPLSVRQLQADLLAAPGHKGLLGPLGTGILYVGPRADAQLHSVRQGGTGTESQQDRQPDTLPQRFEAGNLNVPGIVALGAGVDYLVQRGVEAIRQHELSLVERLSVGLGAIEQVTVYGPADVSQRVGLVSITANGHDSQQLAAALDSGYRIQVRAGLHCAPRMHQRLGTMQTGGTVRFSVGPFNDLNQIDMVITAVQQIVTAG
ncbi:MAG: aminotransferase class V-fold PLP-dependent enzyme [Planctomycetales bacterium]|nr:aminotransferase class V-fold PLP-dependent enzyme [Planctomycetales bacterium]NIM08275.1 aminotransferase class V-fold PLP-dependent enzyme [Planctomycetales bacterium]NIN07768.1 aminotransferase class V-fold PLP-dependent enzyme [Planctomycetales bacterium]NIN76888.1 aminotransferase class V-fold PLP-dependent enzyme [Planctomycetales bacterium]NIO34087.1 aminotransferase class V-fold PLP-dependent enzyme [Planctomycetales bacterium]